MEVAASGLMGVPQESEFDAVGKFLRAREMAPLPRDAAHGVLGHALVSLHGKVHRDRRAIENPLFSSDSLRRYEDEVLEPSIDQAIKGLERSADAEGRVRINVPAFATDLILNISMVLIGVDDRTEGDRRRIFDLIDPLVAAHEVEWSLADPAGVIDRASVAKATFWDEYLEPAYRRRQAAVRDGGWSEPLDLLSVLAESGGAEGEEVVAQECALYLIASVLTTTSTITNAVELLLEWVDTHPEDRSRILDEDDEFLLRCVEETLRVRPPIKPLLLRSPEKDTIVGGCPVSSGTTVGANVGAAHVDPIVYPDHPEKFDPERVPAKQVRRTHYSFGDGPHLCIGRPLVIGDVDAGTQGDAAAIVRALFRADVRNDPTRSAAFYSTARRRYVEYPVTIRVDS
ncbi:cytochrome P450 [Rhodococcus erythropolis]